MCQQSLGHRARNNTNVSRLISIAWRAPRNTPIATIRCKTTAAGCGCRCRARASHRWPPDWLPATSAKPISQLHHIAAHSPWSDAAPLEQVRSCVLPLMKKKAPLQAWVAGDTGVPKKGKHSAGVARQYRGQLGKQENRRVAVSLPVSTAQASLPIAWRLYPPEAWANDDTRRERAGLPRAIRFQTKPRIALDQIRPALADRVEPGVLLADAAYGNDSEFRDEAGQLGWRYVVGIQATTTGWKPGQEPLPAKPCSGRGRPPKLPRRGLEQQPVAVRELALDPPGTACRSLGWRAGTKKKPPRPRFAAVRVRVAPRGLAGVSPSCDLV